ncbi:hypothetical protein MCAMS1_00147 [biofilm metagenome]
MKKVSFDKLVYLDTGFISSKYEEITGKHPDTEFTRIEGKSAKASIQVFTADVLTQEMKKYKLSSIQMLTKIEDKLLSYPDIDKTSLLSASDAKIFWVSGRLSTTEWRDSKTKELDGQPYFYIGEEQADQFPLITKPEYFFSGVEKLISLPKPLEFDIGFSVKALVKVFYCADHSEYNSTKHYISCPYIIYDHFPKTGY